jgi:hypothetical protein
MREILIFPTIMVGLGLFFFLLTNLPAALLMFLLAVLVSALCATCCVLCMTDYLNGRMNGGLAAITSVIWFTAAVVMWVTMPKNTVDNRPARVHIVETVEANQP